MRILESAPRNEIVPANVAEFVMTSVVPLEITTLPVNAGEPGNASEPPSPMIVSPPAPVHGMLQWTSCPAVSTVRPPAPMV